MLDHLSKKLRFKNHTLWLTILGIGTAISYWPIREFLCQETIKSEITTSTLTIMFLIVLTGFGSVYAAWLNKKFSRLHITVRILLWIIGALAVMTYLSFIGYTPRWFFPPIFD